MLQLRGLVGRLAVLSVLVGACSSVITSTGPSSSAEATHSPTAPAASGTRSAAPSPALANRLTTHCSETTPCSLAAGTWTTGGAYAFIPGMSITVPAGWSSREANAGELKLVPTEQPDDAIFLWKDVVAIESRPANPAVLPGVPGTPDGLTASFRKNPDFVSTPTSTTIAGDVPALTYTLAVSPTAAYASRGCPSYPTCANILKDPVHWTTDFYAIGAPAIIRLYLATVGSGTDRHTLVISLDATDPAALERLTVSAAPIIAGLRLPAVIGDQ